MRRFRHSWNIWNFKILFWEQHNILSYFFLHFVQILVLRRSRVLVIENCLSKTSRAFEARRNKCNWQKTFYNIVQRNKTKNVHAQKHFNKIYCMRLVLVQLEKNIEKYSKVYYKCNYKKWSKTLKRFARAMFFYKIKFDFWLRLTTKRKHDVWSNSIY